MKRKKLGLVLSGGGARGAYEAGVLHYIRTELSPSLRETSFDVHCGCSVGAINTAFLASTCHEPLTQTKALISLWEELKSENIYERNISSFLSLTAKTASGILSNLTQLDFFNSRQKKNHFQALLDTTPLKGFLQKHVNWKKLKENVAKNKVDSVALIATKHRTGDSIVFLQKGSKYFKSDLFGFESLDLAPIHAMASAAIPLIFPSIKIDNDYFVDGGMRMNTPLSPAIHLGAEKLLVIGLHAEDTSTTIIPTPVMPPTLGEHLGKLFHSFLLDNLKSDLHRLEQVNRIIDASEKNFGPSYCEKMNATLEYQHRLKKIIPFLIQPSVAISEIFEDWQKNTKKKIHLSMIEQFLLRVLDIHPEVSGDLLSYLAFEKDYLRVLVDLGFQDTKKKHDELEAYLND